MSDTRKIEIDGKSIWVTFEYWPGDESVGVRAEYHILEVTDRYGNPVDVPESVVIEVLDERRVL